MKQAANNTAQFTVATILTVDPQNRIIEATLRDGGKIQIGSWDASVAFRWPKVNEIWTIKRNGISWHLANRIRPVYEQSIEILNPGDILLDSDNILDSQHRKLAVERPGTAMYWRGEYEHASAYVPADVVKNAGTVYMSLAEQQGVDPPSLTWQAL